MPRKIFIATLVLIAVAFGTLPFPAFANEAAIKRAVRDSLKDSDSAKFGLIRNIGDFACAEINAKNSYGGYTGNQNALLSKIGKHWFLLKIIDDISFTQCLTIIAEMREEKAAEKNKQARDAAEEKARIKAEEESAAAEEKARIKAEKEKLSAEKMEADKKAKLATNNSKVESNKASAVEKLPGYIATDQAVLECAGWLATYVIADTFTAIRIDKNEWDELDSDTKLSAEKKARAHPLMMVIETLAIKGGGGDKFKAVLEKSVAPEAAKLLLKVSGEYPEKKKGEQVIIAMPRIQKKAEAVCINAEELGIKIYPISNLSAFTF